MVRIFAASSLHRAIKFVAPEIQTALISIHAKNPLQNGSANGSIANGSIANGSANSLQNLIEKDLKNKNELIN